MMAAKDFFDEVCARIPFTNVDIKTIVPSIKTSEINVDIVDGSMFKVERAFTMHGCVALVFRKCIRMGMKKEGTDAQSVVDLTR